MQTSSDTELSDKTVEELSKWLEENGVPEQYCKKFEGKWNCFLGDTDFGRVGGIEV